MKKYFYSSFPAKSFGQGFTLIEMLAAMAVLAILGIIIAQAFQATSSALARSNKDLDAYGEMRQALDRISLDIASRIKRDDVPLYFQKNAGDDTMVFYSAVPSTLAFASKPRGISRLFYRIGAANGSNPFCLQRSSDGALWSGAGAGALTFVDPASTLVPPTAPTDANFDLLSPAVFRFEISYISAATAPGKIRKTFPSTPGEWKRDVGALCITVAALDGESRKLLKSPATQMAALSLELKDAEDDISTYETWNQTVKKSGALAAATAVPERVTSRIRVMERRFPLN